MSQRIWKPVLGYPGYVVSNLGEIADAKTKRSLEGSWINGYRRVTIQYRGKPVNINPARAVLEAFCGPAPLGKEVDHKNTNRWDNCLENLWWRTHQENMNNSITREKMRKPHKIGKYYDDIPEGIWKWDD